MKFPNALSGVKKIFVAEILRLLIAFTMIVILIMAIGDVALSSSNDSLPGPMTWTVVIFSCAVLLVVLAAFILNIVGLAKASKDEQAFNSALICLILSFIVSVASSLIANPALSGVLSSVSVLLDTFVTIFVISGIIKLGDQCNRGDISAKGSSILKLIIVINLLRLIAELIASFMGGFFMSLVASVITLIAGVLGVIQYVMYLAYLSKAKKMLAK